MLGPMVLVILLWSAAVVVIEGKINLVCQTPGLESEVKEKTAAKVHASPTNNPLIIVDEPILDDVTSLFYDFCTFTVHVYWPSLIIEECSVRCKYDNVDEIMQDVKVVDCKITYDPGANMRQNDHPRNGHHPLSPPSATDWPTENYRRQSTGQQVGTGTPQNIRQRLHSAPPPPRAAPPSSQSTAPKKRRPPPPPPPLKSNKRPDGLPTGSPTATQGNGIQWRPIQTGATRSESALHIGGGGGGGVSPTKQGHRGRRESDPLPNQLRGQPSNGKHRRPPPPPPPKSNQRPNGRPTGSPMTTQSNGMQWPQIQTAATRSEPSLHRGGGGGVSPTTQGHRGRRASYPMPNTHRQQPSNGNQQRQRTWSMPLWKGFNGWGRWWG